MTMPKTHDSITDTLRDIIVSKIKPELDRESVSNTASLLDDGLGLDSIMIVDLIVAVEHQFEFNFAEDDLSLESFSNLNALAKVIERRLFARSLAPA